MTTVDPCIPHTVKHFTVNRLFRNTMYHITVNNPDGVQKGVKAIKVNGSDVPVGPIPVTDRKEVTVEVTMG